MTGAIHSRNNTTQRKEKLAQFFSRLHDLYIHLNVDVKYMRASGAREYKSKERTRRCAATASRHIYVSNLKEKETNALAWCKTTRELAWHGTAYEAWWWWRQRKIECDK